MKIKFVNLTEQVNQISDSVYHKWNEIVREHRFVSGKEVEIFEDKFSKILSTKYVVGLSSGTDANILSILCSDCKDGAEVIIPVNTYIATACGVSHAGAKPIFIDIDKDTFNIDPTLLESLISRKTKAIIPVHLYGYPAEMDKILEIAKRNNVIVIEDASQAHLAEYRGRRVGSLGILSTWSFYPGKNLGAWGEAGAIATDDENIYQMAMKYRNHGGLNKYQHDLIGFNFRMSELQAAVLNVKLNFIEQWTNERVEIAKHYQSRLNKIVQITLPKSHQKNRHVYHLYVIRTIQRDSLKEYLFSCGIETSIHYPTCLHQTKFQIKFFVL